MTQQKFRRRTLTRLAVVQALYQADIMQEALGRPATAYLRDAGRLQSEPALKAVDREMFASLFDGVRSSLPQVDALIAGHMVPGWDMSRLDAVVKAILRSAVYELLQTSGHFPETCSSGQDGDLPDGRLYDGAPKGVILSEYVDITESFYEETDQRKFVNGILSAIGSSLDQVPDQRD